MRSDINLIEISVYSTTDLRTTIPLIIIVVYDMNSGVGSILRLRKNGRCKRMTVNTTKILYSHFLCYWTHSTKATIESDIQKDNDILYSYKFYCTSDLLR